MRMDGDRPAPGEKMTPADAAIVRRQAAGLQSLEVPQDAQIHGEARERAIASINVDRAKRGLAPLENDESADPRLTQKRRSAFERHERARRRAAKSRTSLAR